MYSKLRIKIFFSILLSFVVFFGFSYKPTFAQVRTCQDYCSQFPSDEGSACLSTCVQSNCGVTCPQPGQTLSECMSRCTGMTSSPVQAQDVCNDACSLYTGLEKQTCVAECRNNQSGTNNVFGNVDAPQGVQLFNVRSDSGIGLIPFISNLIKLATIVAGIWVMINIILAGYTYITSSGDTAAHGKVKDKITMSIIGLIIIVAAYTITAIIGLLFFGDAGYILSPNISGPTSSTTTTP